MFRGALFIISKKVEKHQCPSTDEQINKIQYIHVTEYYLAIKKNEVLIYTTLMNLERIMLSERSKKKKTITRDIYYDIIYMKQGQAYFRDILVVAWRLVNCYREEQRLITNGCEVSFRGDKNVLNLHYGNDYTIL